MAYIRKLTSGNYQVQIRRADLKTISKTFKLKKDAKLWAAQIESSDDKLTKLGDPISNGNTLAGLIDNFTEYYNDLLLSGAKKDPNIITRLAFWKRQYGPVTLADFSASHVRAGIKTLAKSGAHPDKPNPVQPGTTNRFKAGLSTAISWAIDEECYGITVNPCRGVTSKKENDGRKRVFTDDEKLRFLEAAKQVDWDKFYLLVLMGFSCGARRGELRKLTWSDIDFQNQQAFCRNTKNGDDKVLHLTPAVIAELKKFRGVGVGEIFIGQRGALHDYRNDWSTAMRLAEIPEVDRSGEKLVFHSERHTFCTDLHTAGVDLETIKTLAGHRNISTTSRYITVDEQVKVDAVDRVFGSLGGAL